MKLLFRLNKEGDRVRHEKHCTIERFELYTLKYISGINLSYMFQNIYNICC